MSALLLTWFACTGAPSGDGAPPEVAPPAPAPLARPFAMEFGNLALTDAMYEATEPSSVTWALVDKVKIDLDFHVLHRRGEGGFGDLVRADGAPVAEDCNNQDFNGMLLAAGHPWLVSHFECTPGAVYLTRMKADEQGRFRAELVKNVDFASVGGIWNPCAGQPSPWGTHLASEEYEPDAGNPPAPGKDSWDLRSWAGMQRYLPDGAALNPYAYGWTPEIAILDAEGGARVSKHKAPGRFSHEIAYVLPDERTVYSSDDGTGGGWFMFVADKPRDLSSGWLYAAKVTQTNATPLTGELAWIALGHADDAYVDGLIAQGVTFDDLFERQAPADGACAEGFRRVRQDGLDECLKLRGPGGAVPDVAKAASRLETRRYAGYLGATTEFEKAEGVTFDPVAGRVFLALSKYAGRALDEGGGPDDHLRLPENECGAITSGLTKSGVTDTEGRLIGSKHVMTTLENVITGTPIPEDAKGNRCLVAGIANPDNIAYLPGYDVLMIAEDTSNHALASLWALELRSGALKRVLVAPPHGEITGIHWIPDLGGHGYLTAAVQHPWKMETLAETVLPPGVTAEHQRSITGYLGPFPKLD